MQELTLPPLPKPDGTAEANICLHPEGGYEFDEVPAWSEPLVKAYAAAALAQQAARHAEELQAYEVTVSNRDAEIANLRAQRVPDAHAIGTGAIYDFMGWLTTRSEKLILSGSHDASPAADAIRDFLKKRGISDVLCNPNIKGWSNAAAPAPEPERQDTLCDRLQQKCVDWKAYWRASDAHGVILSLDQAHELLRDALGVEVEISLPTDEIQDLRDHAVRMLEKSFPQPERKPMTEEQLKRIYRESSGYGGDNFNAFARAVEAFHGIVPQEDK